MPNFVFSSGLPFVFMPVSLESDPLAGIDPKEGAVFTDIDRDDDLDLVIGNAEGDAVWYENTGTPEKPVFVEYNGEANPLADVHTGGGRPVFADVDGDGDEDLMGINTDVFHAGETTYYVNLQTGSRELPLVLALPEGGSYPAAREINLRCLAQGCTAVHYTLDGSEPTPMSPRFEAPFWVDTSSTLHYIAADANGNVISPMFSQVYEIDAVPPQITITDPAGSDTVAALLIIRGTVSDQGSELDRVELQIISEPLFLSGTSRNIFTDVLTWLPIRPNTSGTDDFQQGEWSYDLEQEETGLELPLGKYEIKVRAFDRAGNLSDEASVEVYKAAQARADLTLEFRPTQVADEELTLQGRLTSLRDPPLNENLLNKPPLEVYAWREPTLLEKEKKDCLTPGYDEQRDWRKEPCFIGEMSLPIVSDTGQFYLKTGPLRNYEGKYFLQVRFPPGDDLLKPALSPVRPLFVGRSAGYAVLVQGRAWFEQKDQYEGLDAHNKTLNRIYRTLLEQGFDRENIRYFNYDTQQDLDGDGQANDVYVLPDEKTLKQALRETLTQWLPERLTGMPAPFYMVLVDHGDQDGYFYIDQDESNNTWITPTELNGWLVELENLFLNENKLDALSEPRILVLGMCYSGKALDDLALPGRIVITSAAEGEKSYKGPLEEGGIRGGEYFVDNLFHELGRGRNLGDAYSIAAARTQAYTRSDNANTAGGLAGKSVQNPQFKAHGDTNIAPLTDIKLGVGMELVTNYTGIPAEICGTPANIFLDATTTEPNFNIAVSVNDARRVASARLDVRPPDLNLDLDNIVQASGPAAQRELFQLYRAAENLRCTQYGHTCETSLTPDSQFYSGSADNPQTHDSRAIFAQPGRYELQYFVTDSKTDDISPLHRSFVYKAERTTCESAGQTACNSPPSAFDLLSPVVDDGFLLPTTVRFDWQFTDDPDGDMFTYTLHIAKRIAEAESFREIDEEEDFMRVAEDKDFIHTVLLLQDLRTPYATVDNRSVLHDCSHGLPDRQTYYWQVSAIDVYGTETRSLVRRFIVDDVNANTRDIVDGTLSEYSATLKEGWLIIKSLWIDSPLSQHYTVYLKEIEAERVFEFDDYRATHVSQAQDIEAAFYSTEQQVRLPRVHLPDSRETRYNMVLDLVKGSNPMTFKVKAAE
ncbi:MAG: hypothetical protein GY862_25005 [Gammaproteobacteria bacterium]|nr:hypothetical protein [Gammaproteobacteria bacterium]